MGQGHIDARGSSSPTVNELHPGFIPVANSGERTSIDTNWALAGYEIPDGLGVVQQDTNTPYLRINGSWVSIPGLGTTLNGDVTGASSSNMVVKIQGYPVAVTSAGVGVFIVGIGAQFQTVPMQGDSSVVADGTVTNSGLHLSTGTGITAAGTVQGDATVLTKFVNEVTTTPLLTGVKLPTASAGMTVYVFNRGANTLKIYPATGGQINALGANVADTALTVVDKQYIAVSSTQWYTVP